MNKTSEVLLIDDNDDIRNLVQLLLSKEGYYVRSFSNAQEALELLGQGFKPSLVLVDWWMPIMSGKDFLDKYSELPIAKARIPVYIFSAEGDPEIAKHKVCSGIIKKPIDIAQLLSVLENLPSRHPVDDANL